MGKTMGAESQGRRETTRGVSYATVSRLANVPSLTLHWEKLIQSKVRSAPSNWRSGRLLLSDNRLFRLTIIAEER